MKSRIRRIVILCSAIIMLAIACITFIAENNAADEVVQSEIVSSTDDIKAQESASTTIEMNSITESKTEVTAAMTSVKVASKTNASPANSTVNTSKSNSPTTKKTTSTTKPIEVTVKTTSSTSKPSTTPTTQQTTTKKPTTATTTAKATAVWGSVDKMKSDCRAIAADCGFTWDSSLNKSNSHWITPTYTGAFSSASALKAKIRDFLESYKCDGYDTVNIIFESAGNGEYYLYYCVG